VVSDAPDPRPIRLRYSQNPKNSYRLSAVSFPLILGNANPLGIPSMKLKAES
jgi:hypothetical protein